MDKLHEALEALAKPLGDWVKDYYPDFILKGLDDGELRSWSENRAEVDEWYKAFKQQTDAHREHVQGFWMHEFTHEFTFGIALISCLNPGCSWQHWYDPDEEVATTSLLTAARNLLDSLTKGRSTCAGPSARRASRRLNGTTATSVPSTCSTQASPDSYMPTTVYLAGSAVVQLALPWPPHRHRIHRG